MYELAKNSKVLDVNSDYCYLMWSTYFPNSSMVATYNHQVIGFITGFVPPENKDTLFIWQIAIDEDYRGNGLATKMIDALYSQMKNQNIRYIEATVTPSNTPSNKLFSGLARKKGANYTITRCFEQEDFPDNTTEEEFAYRIGPITWNENN